MNELINKAITFAVKKHEGQKRKGTDFPYIVHIYDVMQILQENNAPLESVLAGILHDTVEDTNTTLDEIETNFGKNIRNIVDVLTEKKELPYTERKLLQAQRLKNASFQTKMVKCADCLSNLKAIKNELTINSNLWNKFNASKQNIQLHYFHTIKAMEDLAIFEMYKKLKTMYEKVFSEKLTETNSNQYCNNCSYMKRLPDPDPYDWFCDDDEKFVCGVTNKVLSTGNRPYEKQPKPSDCPIK